MEHTHHGRALARAIRRRAERSVARSLKRAPVEPIQPEMGREALGPLVVVEQRPVEVAADVGTGRDRVVKGAEVAAQVPGALVVLGIVDAVLGHVDRLAVLRGLLYHLPKSRRVDLPAEVGAGRRTWRAAGVTGPAIGHRR